MPLSSDVKRIQVQLDNEKNYELTDRGLINFLAEERMTQLAEIETRSGEDYEIDPEVWQRLIDVTEYLCKLVDWFGGTVKPCEVNLKKPNVRIEAKKIGMVSLDGEETKEFFGVMSKCDTFSIFCCTEGGIALVADIYDVYRKKQNE